MRIPELKSKVLEYMIIISFVMNVFSNIISFYLTGNSNDLIRKVISWGIMVTITLVLVIYVLKKFFLAEKHTKRKILLCLIPAFVNGVVLVWALVTASSMGYIFKQCVSFGVYCVPLVCGAVYIMLEKKFESIVFKAKYVTLIMVPFYSMAIIYFWNLTPISELGDGFGGLVYLSIGYSAIPLYAFLIYDLIDYFINKSKQKIRLVLVFVEIIICSLIVISAGSRGVLLSWAAVSILAVFVLLLKKERKAINGVGVSAIAIVLFCILAPADNVALNRQFAFIEELKGGALKQSFVSEEGQQLLNELFVHSDGNRGMTDIAQNIKKENELLEEQETGKTAELVVLESEKLSSETDSSEAKPEVVKPSETKTEVPEDLEDGNDGNAETNAETSDQNNPSDINSEYQDRYQDAVFSVTNGSMARSYLWQLAIREMQEKPLRGMGAVGYQQKYKTYPHNILLECLADFGIIGFGVFFVACAMLLILFIKYSIKSWMYVGMMLVLVGEVVNAMLSGNIYVCPCLLFAFTIIILQLVQSNEEKSKKGEIHG